MPRKGPAPRREITPDPIYRSVVVTQLVNKILQRGKRSLAERIVYDSLDIVQEKTGSEPIATLKRAVDNVRPQLEVRHRHVVHRRVRGLEHPHRVRRVDHDRAAEPDDHALGHGFDGGRSGVVPDGLLAGSGFGPRRVAHASGVHRAAAGVCADDPTRSATPHGAGGA